MKTKIALRQLRRERGRIEREPNRFNQYKEHYSKIFSETKALAGPDAMKELVEWTASQTKRTKRLPTPAMVRKRGAEICTDRGHMIPEDSILAKLN